jgi:hypothetical protein
MGDMMSVFSAELERFGDQLEELIAQVASEKMQVAIEDVVEGRIPDIVEQKVDEAFEELDLPGQILRKVGAVDVQALARTEVQKTIVKLFEEQLGGMVRKQIHLILVSDEIKNLITNRVAGHAKALMESGEIARNLEELVKEGMSRTLQQWTATLVQGHAPAPNRGPAQAEGSGRISG